MKAWFFIFVMAMGPVGASAQAYQRQEQQVSRSVDLERDLTSYSLSDRQLTAFGRRGEQKLQDFYDLMGYQANAQYSTMNSVSDTRQRTTDLFLDSTVTVAPLFEAGLPLPLVVFLDSVESTYSAVEIQLDSMAWVQPLVPSLDGLYQGRLEYVLVARGYQIGEAVTEHTGIQQAEVYLQQVEKSFGRRGSNLVWEVKLGSIRWAEGE